MKILIVGLGSIGQRHLRNILFLFPKTEIYVYRRIFISPTLDNNNNVLKKKLEIKYNFNLVKTYAEGLNKKPDAVFICNPTSMHIDYAIKAAKKNINIFMEKPLSNNFKKIDQLKYIVNKNKLFFMIGFQFRFHPIIKKIKKIIDKKIIGTIIGGNIYNGEYLPNFHKYEDYKISYASRKDLGGGVVLSQIHDIDICYYLFGSPYSINATGGKYSNLKIDVEDFSNASLKYYNKNQKCFFSISLTQDYLQNPPIKKGMIIGSKGIIVWDYITSELKVNFYNKKNYKYYIFSKFSRNQMFIDELKYFFKYLKKGQKNDFLNLDDSINSLKIALSIKKSHDKDKAIKIK